jgi:hypothetical protein
VSSSIDARLERCEVARGPRQEVVGDVLLEAVLAAAARGKTVHGVPQRAIARARDVSYSLNWLASGASEISLT